MQGMHICARARTKQTGCPPNLNRELPTRVLHGKGSSAFGSLGVRQRKCRHEVRRLKT